MVLAYNSLVMKLLFQQLAQKPIVFIARDLERALGLPPTPGYYIITNASEYSKSIAKIRKDITLVEADQILDTRELLTHETTKQFLATHPVTNVLVFKNTSLIERAAADLGLTILNPLSNLGREIEEKLSQLTWLKELTKYLPPHFVAPCKELRFEDKPMVVQFNHAHTGLGTTLINESRDLKLLQTKFPNRDVRVTDYITGPAFTINSVVWGQNVLTGNINYQITGLPPFTDKAFATIGNDWAAPVKLLKPDQTEKILEITQAIGNKLVACGWKGLYGVDFIVDDNTDTVYLIEINARQPASTTYESQLQEQYNLDIGIQDNELTTFQAHLAALLDCPYSNERILRLTNGAQIIVRNAPGNENAPAKIEPLVSAGFNVIGYNNTEPGSDLLRIQSPQGIIKNHNEFNDNGEKIISCL